MICKAGAKRRLFCALPRRNSRSLHLIAKLQLLVKILGLKLISIYSTTPDNGGRRQAAAKQEKQKQFCRS
jgi:hypothetical protein